MKKQRGLKIFFVCFLIGLGIGWLILRSRGDDDAGRKANLAYADAEAGFDAARDFDGNIVVDFADDVTPAYVAEVAQRVGIELKADSDWVDHDRIYVAHVDPSDEAHDLDELRADPRVEAAEENFVYGIPEAALADAAPVLDETKPEKGKFPNDPRYAEQWHMRQLHMEETWPEAQGAGVIVAVIDTGVSKVQDLKQTEFVQGWNFVNNSPDSADDHGHGTHVAGTIAQSTNNGVGVAGVAYRAKIMPLKVLSAQGSGSVTGIAEAIRWAADHDAKVINMSLGGRMASQVLAKAVKYAHDKGVTVICAAGNDGQGKVSYPAAYPGAVAVAATQKDEKTTFYSNWGKAIDVAAPGGNTRGDATGGVLQNTLYQGKDDYFFFMGTSMASPHVAGVAALVVGAGVTNPDAVENVLKDTARKPQNVDVSDDYALHYGAGIVDAQAAVKKARAKDAGTGAFELGIASLLGGIVVLGLRRRGMLGSFGLGGLVALIVGSGGFFFLPWVGQAHFFGAGLLSHGMPAWDGVLFGAGHHGNILFYSALLPLVAGGLLYGRPRLRGLVAGLSLGYAGHLLASAALGGLAVTWMPFTTAWLVGNGLFCLFLAYAVARK